MFCLKSYAGTKNKLWPGGRTLLLNRQKECLVADFNNLPVLDFYISIVFVFMLVFGSVVPKLSPSETVCMSFLVFCVEKRKPNHKKIPNSLI